MSNLGKGDGPFASDPWEQLQRLRSAGTGLTREPWLQDSPVQPPPSGGPEGWSTAATGTGTTTIPRMRGPGRARVSLEVSPTDSVVLPQGSRPNVPPETPKPLPVMGSHHSTFQYSRNCYERLPSRAPRNAIQGFGRPCAALSWQLCLRVAWERTARDTPRRFPSVAFSVHVSSANRASGLTPLGPGQGVVLHVFQNVRF